MSTNSETRTAVGWIVGIIVLIALVSIGAWAFQVATADVKGRGDQVVKTKGNADYRIGAYDKFYDDCAAIQTAETRLAAAKEAVKSATSAEERKQLTQNVLALEATRAQLINQYNVDARKADTRGAFLASDLPYHIEPTQETTSCTA